MYNPLNNSHHHCSKSDVEGMFGISLWEDMIPQIWEKSAGDVSEVLVQSVMTSTADVL